MTQEELDKIDVIVNLKVEAVNVILEALSEGTFKVVAPVHTEVLKQVSEQVNAIQSKRREVSQEVVE